jgi:splicing factor 3A subunit 2
MAQRREGFGSKIGTGGVASEEQVKLARRERLRQLASETVDLAADPFYMRNHLGTVECKLCLTRHPSEANYIAHTQGKKHQGGIARREFMDRQRKGGAAAGGGAVADPRAAERAAALAAARRRLKVGRPGYRVVKQLDPVTGTRALVFALEYPEIAQGIKPRFRFLSAFEQRREPPDAAYQYLLFAADPYETIAMKIPNEPIERDPGLFYTHWHEESKTFNLRLQFVRRKGAGGAGAEADDDSGDEAVEA